jgi:hypothetical protein
MSYGGRSHYTEIEEQLVCANCGKKAGGYYETIILPEGEPYKGNSRVVSQKEYFPGSKRTVWRLNRGTYRAFKYGTFCTALCAIRFANEAVVTGYQRETE